jgi:hypothetical protein
MCCYWDGDYEGYDDEALQNLGEHIIRLMERFSAAASTAEHDGDATKPASFRESWGKTVLESQKPIVEFSYYEDDDDDDEEDDETEDDDDAP